LGGTGWLTGREPEVSPGRRRGDPTPRSAGDEPDADQERLDHRLDGLGFFPDGDRERVQADRSPVEPGEHRLEHRAVESVQPVLVDVVELEGALHRGHAVPGAVHEGVVPDAAEQTVRDARRAP
jgi:hypothetical protein